MKDWMKGCLIWGSLILGGWLLVIGIGYAILRGILSFIELFEE